MAGKEALHQHALETTGASVARAGTSTCIRRRTGATVALYLFFFLSLSLVEMAVVTSRTKPRIGREGCRYCTLVGGSLN